MRAEWRTADFSTPPSAPGTNRTSRLSAMANQIYFSKPYTVFYVGMLVVNAVLFVLLVKQAIAAQTPLPGAPWTSIQILEIVISVAFCIEVGLRIISMGSSYWRSCGNMFDAAIALFSLSSLILLFRDVALAVENFEEAIISVLLLLRYGVQLARLIAMLRNQQLQQRWTHNDVVIDFSSLRDISGDESSVEESFHV